MDKYERLKDILHSLGSVAVAFSAGVDSTLLLYVAHEALKDKAVAVTVASPLIPKEELEQAEEYCRSLGVRQMILEADVLGIEGFSENPADRCYICKKHIFRMIKEKAAGEGILYVAEGSNTDDDKDYRPGRRAIEELGIKSPLKEAGLGKSGIRELSEKLGLPTWDKPSLACLASRIPYGDEITEKKLEMIGEAEGYLKGLGFRQLRVRLHGDMARIELEPSEITALMDEDIRTAVNRHFREKGFSYVSLDLEGYRTGSMNKNVTDPQGQ